MAHLCNRESHTLYWRDNGHLIDRKITGFLLNSEVNCGICEKAVIFIDWSISSQIGSLKTYNWIKLLQDHTFFNGRFFIYLSSNTRLEKRKEINKYSKGKFLQIRKQIPADKEIFTFQKETFFWQVKIFLFIDNRLLTLQIPDYQQAFFWACII